MHVTSCTPNSQGTHITSTPHTSNVFFLLYHAEYPTVEITLTLGDFCSPLPAVLIAPPLRLRCFSVAFIRFFDRPGGVEGGG